MKKDFSISNEKVMINFTVKYCDTPEKLLNSNGFKKVLEHYLDKIRRKNTNRYKFLSENMMCQSKEKMTEELIRLFKLLIALDVNEVCKLNREFESLLDQKQEFINFVEELYNFWRRLERYTIVQSNKVHEGLAKVSFIEANNKFTTLVLDTYRKIEEKVLGLKPTVYRQLPAGSNAGIILNDTKWPVPKEYEVLKEIPFFDSIMLNLPFITYPKKNTREGIFEECFQNPLRDCKINPEHWFCYPAKVGTLLAYIYIHRDFMAQGITLCNLFEMAREEEYRGVKPDIVYVYGAKDNFEKVRTVFYDDVKNDIMLGYISYGDAIDYFGYMKKMTLTLHNLIMIKRGYLPLHGAMVNIITKTGETVNVAIVGDSGAGKSESLEAFRILSEDYISQMTVIFDDMGVAKLHSNGKIFGYGTEVGAFVRLDDLDPGYAFKAIDRSIFMNPDKTNARLVMPVASYEDIVKGYEINYLFYANNYEEVKDDKKELDFFKTPEEAIKVFRSGARMAKGTTSEKGLVESYFANPFGPVQRKKEVDILLNKYFNKWFENKVKVGEIRTSLGVKGKEKEGPVSAAKKLFELIIKR